MIDSLGEADRVTGSERLMLMVLAGWLGMSGWAVLLLFLLYDAGSAPGLGELYQPGPSHTHLRLWDKNMRGHSSSHMIR